LLPDEPRGSGRTKGAAGESALGDRRCVPVTDFSLPSGEPPVSWRAKSRFSFAANPPLRVALLIAARLHLPLEGARASAWRRFDNVTHFFLEVFSC
jgi:hypothetical protein